MVLLFVSISVDVIFNPSLVTIVVISGFVDIIVCSWFILVLNIVDIVGFSGFVVSTVVDRIVLTSFDSIVVYLFIVEKGCVELIWLIVVNIDESFFGLHFK